jgi:hypothetical protein
MSLNKPLTTKVLLSTAALLAASALNGCTGQLPGSFRLSQQEQTFSSELSINTKIDLLWVVDNSSSMDIAQDRLRKGFATFAAKYMKPTWDVRVAVITTDTYLADPAWQAYLGAKIVNNGISSPYIIGRLGNFTNPTKFTDPVYANPGFNTSLVDVASTGKFLLGVKYSDMIPVWGANWGKLLPGLHDGPIPGLCYEKLPYFMHTVGSHATNCRVRDAAGANTGAAACLTPGAGESAISQCVNTLTNDTVHSGKAIIETMPPTGTPADAAWSTGLVNDFTINLTTGTVGHGSERGFGSVLQLISDNEPTANAFFRAGSLRGIVFVSDEDDQTMTIEDVASRPSPFTPWSHYRCDQAGLIAGNSAAIANAGGNCCIGNSCAFGDGFSVTGQPNYGITCPSKTVDAHTYTVSYCADAARLKPVTEVKDSLDSFFLGLDGTTSDPNYFVITITPATGQAIVDLQALRNDDDVNARTVNGSTLNVVATDRADRYIALGALVGNGSAVKDMAETNYDSILDDIGKVIVQKKGAFTLVHAPTASEDMIVWLKHQDGTVDVIDASKFTIVDKTLTVTDLTTVLSFKSTDKIVINYQPKNLD